MKKKLIAAALSVVMTMSLAGCSGELSNEYITIKQYKGLEVAQVTKTEVTDEKLESTINSYLTASQTRDEVTDRAAAEGDTVDIDYVGTIDGVEFDGGSATGASLELGSGSYIGAEGDYQGFEEQIIGHNTGEEFDITVKFPADYQNTEVADKVAQFHITLNGIYLLSTPELTDEWVQQNSTKSKTVEEFRKEIRDNMENSNEESYKSTLRQEVLEALMEQVEVKKLPQDQVDEEYQSIDEYYKEYAQNYGMEFADFLTNYMSMTEEEFAEKAKEVAETAVKRKLACELLAKKKKLEPSDKKYEEEIARYAEQSGYEDTDEFLKAVGEDVVKQSILQQAVADWLAESCVQVEASSEAE